MLIWPTDLLVFYPFQASWPVGIVAFAILLVAGVSLATIWLGRERGYWSVGWFWFFGTLVPVIGLVQVGAQSIADRYTYLRSIGLFIVVAWGADEVRRRWRMPGVAAGALGAAAAVACLAVTRHQSVFWGDDEVLFRRVAAVRRPYTPHLVWDYHDREGRNLGNRRAAARAANPKVALTYLNLGYLAGGGRGEAVVACREAARLEPKMLSAGNWPLQLHTGDGAGAVESFQQSTPSHPITRICITSLDRVRSERRFDEAVSRSVDARTQPTMATGARETDQVADSEGPGEEARTEGGFRLAGLGGNNSFKLAGVGRSTRRRRSLKRRTDRAGRCRCKTSGAGLKRGKGGR